MSTPQWVQDAVFYQIFPDRFANGDPGNDPPRTAAWGSPPKAVQFQGGDLRGVIQKFDYLLDLGINALYFNPIFEAVSNHRYDTVDYLQIDRKLGTLGDFKELLDLAHCHGIKVILDGVFNHCGRGFYAFLNLMEYENQSCYQDWYHVYRFPLNAYTPGKAVNFEAWWGYKSLPKFNTDSPDVRRMILNVARYWIEQGADGWRLDVPNEINDDGFWGEFRQVVKAANPEAYILGEIWEAEPRWVNERMFDAVMNYPVRRAVIQWLNGEIKAPDFAGKVESLFNVYPEENVRAMYVPLGSHDTERLFTILGGDLRKVMLAFLFQFIYPGAPAVYYGDEIGLTGGRDPECRKAFPWEPSEWNSGLREYVKKLVAVRKAYSALRRGSYRRLLADAQQQVYVVERSDENNDLVVILNASSETRRVTVPLDWKQNDALQGMIQGSQCVLGDGHLDIQLPAYSGEVLVKPAW